MTIPYFEVFAFTNRQFAGNPTGVCVLAGWLPERVGIGGNAVTYVEGRLHCR